MADGKKMLHQKRTFLKIGVTTVLLLWILGSVGWSQARKKEKGPRALGVVEILQSGKARLIPITILVGDQWFDAGLYMAAPRPMALESDTVYEIEKNGESEGLFTVKTAQQMNGNWIGLGTWKPKDSEPAPKKVTVGKPANSAAELEDERPILRKPGSSTSSKSGASTPSTTPQSTSPTAAPAGTAPQPAEQKVEAKPTPAPRRTEEDPGRPVLRRGKPGVEQAESIGIPSSPDDFAPAGAKSGVAGKPIIARTLAAVSDASGPEPRSYVFHTNPGEREDYSRRIAAVASQALRKFMQTRAPGASVPAITIDNSRTQIFDAGNNNEPVLILTARVPAAETTTVKKVGGAKGKSGRVEQATVPPTANVGGLEYYVTIVARVDVTGDLRKLFESVTDSTRLDAYPRLDLIDVVDANGDGAGELLFRETYDRSREYVLYRVGMDQLWQLFEGAQSGF